MEGVRTSEPPVDKNFTRQYNPEDSSEHHTRRRENLKSHIRSLFRTCIKNCLKGSVIRRMNGGSTASKTTLQEVKRGDFQKYLELPMQLKNCVLRQGFLVPIDVNLYPGAF
jgi:hypothetical protein